ncbi:TIGR02281 family clan AA aspartic protease [Rhizobiaceae bacterium n13]|uniref:TIGR02281 family clan AA aspartic protease n=1 Tax=Ferirhizobium litorale TaxID=2927786 RepID=A0AAE3QHD9_9HYPH|nr:TIGR02281 family clan AA aspartic protease [Fererhizobium litorale]MDI7862829.1 TIGR02281 family clan AA aspartic protease [Fererhizobium litorale]MDI7923933.1 TIGR02281 family clan AA aspartic protease [Fererhizobium litorale]
MLARVLFFVGIVAVLAVQLPTILQKYSESVAAEPEPAAEVTVPAPVVYRGNNKVTLRADRQGHYNGIFKINGKPIDGLIDTGATYVAINESTAKHLGFSGNSLDFRHPISTANGQIKAAHVVLSRMEIGGIRVHDVDAVVVRDRSLSSTLVGMSFLKKLDSFSVVGSNLELVQ